MLTLLRIRNLALVEEVVMEPGAGYLAITGETGAGKSVLLGALNLALGERADRAMIRSQSDQCSVEAVFDIKRVRSPVASFLEENGVDPCEDGILILRRILTRSGANRQFINGSPVALSTLAGVGEWLVDIHGPHDHQSLLHPQRQLDVLDAYGGHRELRREYRDWLDRWRSARHRKKELVMDEAAYRQQLDLLRFQVREIQEAGLSEDEAEELEAEYQRAANAARLAELTQATLQALDGEEGSLMQSAGGVGRLLHEMARYDVRARSLAELHAQSVGMLNELQNELSSYADGLETDPHRLEELERRLNRIQSLKRKYGGGVDEVLDFGRAAAEKLENLERREEVMSGIDAEIEHYTEQIREVGGRLSEERRRLIPRLGRAIQAELKDLGFADSRFDVAHEADFPSGDSEWGSSGIDRIEFQFAPNPGEPFKPLRAIASSGEMARVMLAIKTVLAAVDEVPVLIFDEIDANVGGETAVAIGEKMRQLGERHQVICITHLAPVAATASAHWVVDKKVESGRTRTMIRPLTATSRVDELARMLGGRGKAQKQHAKVLLQKGGPGIASELSKQP